jgi:hypothetical protein
MDKLVLLQLHLPEITIFGYSCLTKTLFFAAAYRRTQNPPSCSRNCFVPYDSMWEQNMCWEDMSKLENELQESRIHKEILTHEMNIWKRHIPKKLYCWRNISKPYRINSQRSHRSEHHHKIILHQEYLMNPCKITTQSLFYERHWHCLHKWLKPWIITSQWLLNRVPQQHR